MNVIQEKVEHRIYRQNQICFKFYRSEASN